MLVQYPGRKRQGNEYFKPFNPKYYLKIYWKGYLLSSYFLFPFKSEMKSVKKSDLPEKICVTCKRPFSWRKKWEKNWEEVKYCSQKCSLNKSKNV
jgi:hypothetical protein